MNTATHTEPARTGIFPFYDAATKYDFWQYIPMDQGGRLVQFALIGSEKDSEIAAAVRSPGFFEPWMRMNREERKAIVWDGLEKIEIEKSVWLNRWYYLPSFARLFHLTGDAAYLAELFALFEKWTDENPVPEDLPAYFASGKYNWRDMQAAWRTQNIVWCYFLGKSGWTPDQSAALRESIKTHAAVLLSYFVADRFTINNHQSHGAVAMLYAGLLFPDLPSATALVSRGIAILERHLEEAFYEDGNSVELVPGYYPFFVSNFRDAWLLCRANGIPLGARWENRLRQFHRCLLHFRQPDGTMPSINDSTESDSRASLETLEQILGIERSEPGSVCFQDSHQAVLRDAAGAYVFLDAGPRILAHWHAGKLGLHCWIGGRAILVDSGICNYDQPERRAWYTTAEAHNTILVDGAGDYDRWDKGIEQLSDPASGIANAGSRISAWISTPLYDIATMTHDAFITRAGVAWTRRVVLLKGRGIVLLDRLESDAFHDYTWLFHFAPIALRKGAEPLSFVTDDGGPPLTFAPFEPGLFSGVKVTEVLINRQGRDIKAPLVKYSATAAVLHAAFLLFPAAANAGKLESTQRELPGGVALRIETAGEAIEMLFDATTFDVQFSRL